MRTGTHISAVWALGLGFQELTDEKNPAHSDFSPSYLPPTQMKDVPCKDLKRTGREQGWVHFIFSPRTTPGPISLHPKASETLNSF